MKASELVDPVPPDFEDWTTSIGNGNTVAEDLNGLRVGSDADPLHSHSFTAYRQPGDPADAELVDATEDTFVFRVLNEGNAEGDIEFKGGSTTFQGVSVYWHPSADLEVYWPDGGEFFQPGFFAQIWVRISETGGTVTVELADAYDSWTTLGTFAAPEDWTGIYFAQSCHNSTVGSRATFALNPDLAPPLVPKLGDLPPDQFDDLAFPLWYRNFNESITLDDYGVVATGPYGYMEVVSGLHGDGTETSVVFHFDVSDADASADIYVGSGSERVRIIAGDHAHSQVRDPASSTSTFAWLDDDRWVRYTETGGTTTWEAAGEDKDWRTIGTYATGPSVELFSAVDFGVFPPPAGVARAFSFNVPDDPAPPPSANLVHPFTAAVYDREGNAQEGALVEIQTFVEHEPANVWRDHDHTDYVSDPSTLLTDADGLLTVWLADGLYRWRSTFESVSSGWEPVELQDPLSGPRGAPGAGGAQGPAGTPGAQGPPGSPDVVRFAFLYGTGTGAAGPFGPYFLDTSIVAPVIDREDSNQLETVVVPPGFVVIPDLADGRLTVGLERRTPGEFFISEVFLGLTAFDDYDDSRYGGWNAPAFIPEYLGGGTPPPALQDATETYIWTGGDGNSYGLDLDLFRGRFVVLRASFTVSRAAP